jgi:hypothetical protein
VPVDRFLKETSERGGGGTLSASVWSMWPFSDALKQILVVNDGEQPVTVKQSNLGPSAGRGLFAKRAIPAGAWFALYYGRLEPNFPEHNPYVDDYHVDPGLPDLIEYPGETKLLTYRINGNPDVLRSIGVDPDTYSPAVYANDAKFYANSAVKGENNAKIGTKIDDARHWVYSFLISSRNIDAGEEIYVDYGAGFRNP